MADALPYLAISMGLLSSFHCIGMCGPIALALPVQRGSKVQQVGGLLAYNTGRALSYAALGAILGVAGGTFSLLGYLKYVSVFAGIVMLGYVCWPQYLTRFFTPPGVLQHAVAGLKKRMSALLKKRSVTGWLLLGMLNGLLPCGLVYLALVSSLATGSIAGGALFMFAFGAGTLPAMMAVGFFKNWLTPAVRTRFHQITPFLIAFAGIWLLYRSTLISFPAQQEAASPAITVCHGK